MSKTRIGYRMEEILHTLYDRRGMTAKELLQEFGLSSPATLHPTLIALMSRGFLERRRGFNLRAWRGPGSGSIPFVYDLTKGTRIRYTLQVTRGLPWKV